MKLRAVSLPCRTPGGRGHAWRVALGALLAWALLGGFGLRLNHPLAFGQDHLFLLLHGRLFLEWPAILRNGHLGFPGGIDLLAFPFSDLTQRLLQFLGTMASGRVFAGAHAYAATVVAANVAAAYAALFVFTRRPGQALVGAVAFATIPFFTFRLGTHDYLAAYYPAPLAFILLHRLAGAERAGPLGAAWRGLARDPVAWGCAAIIATSGIYFSFFGVMLLGVGAAALSLLRRSGRPLLLVTALVAPVLGVLALALAPFVLHQLREGVQFPPRGFQEQAMFGTRLADVLRLFDALPVQALQRYGLLSGQFEGFDFWPGPLLSAFVLLACLAAPALAWRGTGGAPAGPRVRRAEMAQVVLAFLCFALLFTTPWGLGMVFNVLVSPEIRAQNRIAPFFAFGALVLALWNWRAAARWLARRCGRKPGLRLALLALAALAGVNGMASLGALQRDQRAMLASPDYQQEIASLDRVLAAAEAEGPGRVLQLPVVSWPEQPRIRDFEPYWHMRPFIRSRRDSPLQWSYGHTAPSPGLALLRLALRTGQPEALPARLRCLGFTLVLLERRAHTAEAMAEWDATLRSGGSTLLLEDTLRRLYRLGGPALPGCAPFQFPRGEWLPVTAGSTAEALLGPGWNTADAQMAWGAGRRHVLHLPVAAAGQGDLRLDSKAWVLPQEGTWHRRLRLRMAGEVLGEWQFDNTTNLAERSLVIPRRLLPAAGFARLELEVDRAGVAGLWARNGDTRLLGVALMQLRLEEAR